MYCLNIQQCPCDHSVSSSILCVQVSFWKNFFTMRLKDLELSPSQNLFLCLYPFISGNYVFLQRKGLNQNCRDTSFALDTARNKNLNFQDLKTLPLLMESYSCNRNETETVAPSFWLFCLLKPLHLFSWELLWADEVFSPWCVILLRMSRAVCARSQLLWQPRSRVCQCSELVVLGTGWVCAVLMWADATFTPHCLLFSYIAVLGYKLCLKVILLPIQRSWMWSESCNVSAWNTWVILLLEMYLGDSKGSLDD